jgi:hypothetical protein
LLVVSPSCGDEGPAPLESASVCSAGWQPITAEEPYDTSSPLRYQDGTLYYGSFSHRGIVAQPVTGGAPALFPTSWGPDALWIDGDHLLFTGGNLGTQFSRMPITGGAPELILDASVGRSDAGWGVAHELTETEIFWSEGSTTMLDGPTTVWRAPRAGGAPVQVGTASAIYPTGDVLVFSSLAVAPDAVLLAAHLGIAAAVPLDGSAVRSLATAEALTKAEGSFAGIDATGVYWSVPRTGSRAEDDEWKLALSPADGGPVRDFWKGLPSHSGVTDIWPRDGGGWVVAASQLFDDRRFHVTVWEIEANGDSRRLACSPNTADGRPYIEVEPAIAPDAIYLVDSGGKFQIIRVPR